MAQIKYVSFAGIGLSLLTPELEDRINLLLPLADFKDWNPWNFQGYDLGALTTPPLPVAPELKVGNLYWPNDATRPAWYHAVVDDRTLNRILAVVPDPLQPQSLILRDDTNTVTASMYLLPPRPVSQMGTDEDGWLITLTDQRFYWPWKSGNITSISTWTALFASIGTILGVSITVDTINSAYATPSSKWKSYLRPAATLLDAAAAQVGQRVVVDLDGTVRTVNWEAAQTASDNQITDTLKLTAGGEIALATIAPYVPESVTVAFADWSNPSLPVQPAPAPKTYVKTLASLAITGYGSQTGVAGASVAAFADFGYDGTNNATCLNLAAVIAEDWYGWRLGDLDLAIPGVYPWSPTGWEDYIEWVGSLKISASAGQPHDPFVLTRVRRGEWSDFPSGHWTGDKPGTSGPDTKSNCARFFGLLRPGSCFTLAIKSASGACSCIDTSQTANLFWANGASAATSTDHLYGCPPGVVTTHCPSGAPRKFTVTVASFTGTNCTALNRTWTLTWTSGETWSQSFGGVTATYTYSGGNFVLTFTLNSDSSVLAVYTGAVTCCAANTLTRTSFAGCDAAPASLTITPATSCGLGSAYSPVLGTCNDSCGRPEARLTWQAGTGSGGASIVFSNVECGVDGSGKPYMEFSSSSPLICTGTADTSCGDNSVVVRVTCATCPTYTLNCTPPMVMPSMICVTGTINPSFIENVPVHLTSSGSGGLATYEGSASFNIPQGGFVPPSVTTITIRLQVSCGIGAALVYGVSICYNDTFYGEGDFVGTGAFARASPYFSGEDWTGAPGSTCGGTPATSPELLLMWSDVAASDGDCSQLNPPSQSFNCLSDGSCIDPGDGSGAFSTLDECAASCGGGGGGGGPNDCPCGTELDSHPTLNATWTPSITGSPVSGTLTWSSGTTYSGTVDGATATLTCSGGIWHLNWKGIDVNAASQGCGKMYANFNVSSPPAIVGTFFVNNP